MEVPVRSNKSSKNRRFICLKTTDIKTTDENSVNITCPTCLRCEYHGCSCVLSNERSSFM